MEQHDYWSKWPLIVPGDDVVRDVTIAAIGEFDEARLGHYGKLISLLGMALAAESLDETIPKAPGVLEQQDVALMEKLQAASEMVCINLGKYFDIRGSTK